jgi:serine phosphatase RsbU (regulator of sigma subunit)
MYERQQERAERLQRGLLPTRVPDVANHEIATLYRAGAQGMRIGGDWYDVNSVAETDLTLVVGDVVGHDLDAAIAMAHVRSALAGLSYAETDPVRILDALDNYCADTAGTQMTTVWYGRLDPTSGRLRYCRAGHPPAMIRRANGAVDQLEGATGAPLGIAGAQRTSGIASLREGDTLIVYTDGLIECRGEDIAVGKDRLCDELTRAPRADLGALVDRLVDRVADPHHEDDIAILAVRRQHR